MILHALEQDNAIATRFDLVNLHIEMRPEPQSLNLVLDQPLGRILQALLNFSNTNATKARIPIVIINQHLSKKMRLARAISPPMHPCSAMAPARVRRL